MKFYQQLLKKHDVRAIFRSLQGNKWQITMRLVLIKSTVIQVGLD